MAGEVMLLLAATWGMLVSLFGLVVTAVGAFVVTRWCWRKALAGRRQEA